MNFGVYFHVPFCARSCDFCSFHQEAPKKSELELYLSGMKKEIELSQFPKQANTAFWGGGTPGLLKTQDLKYLGELMLSQFGKPSEWTIEMAPSTVKKDKLIALKEMGVNRISLGIQSFNEDILNNLGRIHSTKMVYKAIDTIKDVGFQNLNVDMMFSIPGQSPEMWIKDLEEAIRLDVQHISTYCLTFEEDTALWLKLSKGEIKAYTEYEEAAFYEKTWELLEANNFKQYEISNFSKPGFQCQHNLDTWSMNEWLGFGPSASSQFQNQRWTNLHDNKAWREGLEKNQRKFIDETKLDTNTIESDKLIFGLRMNRGVSIKKLEEILSPETSQNLLQLFNQLKADNFLIEEKQNIRLTKKGRLLCDQIAVDILDCF